ncbi:MAG: phage tail protein [Desulfobacterales bacterium]|nr:phage tail protein [Desulfobacterales bacterium]
MSDFDKLLLTNKGRDLMAKGQIGIPIHFTRVILGDGSLAEGQNIELLEAVINARKDVPIHSLDNLGDGTSEVRVILTNEGLAEGFYVREIGLMATDPDLGEILYAYTNAGAKADFMPGAGGATAVEIQLGLISKVGNAENVTAAVGTVILALREDVENHDTDPKAHAGRLNAIEDGLILDRKFSPHKIQVELFSPGYTLYDTTTWIVDQAAGNALAIDGGVYEVNGLIIHALNQDKAVVIRRTDNDGIINGFYRDADHPAWTPAEWAWQRDAGSGFIDVEYQVPARGLFDMRFMSIAGPSAVDPVVDYMVFVECESGLGGIPRPPATPAVVFPADAAIDIGEQPSLTTSAFSSPVGQALQGGRFQISTHIDFTGAQVIKDSGVVSGISWAPEKGVLSTSTAYYVRALHADVYGGISEWSAPVSFTTAATFITVDKPTCTAPAAGSELGTPDGLTLVSSAFSSSGGGDTHKSSQWQVAGDSAFTNILNDSGIDAVNLTSYNVPDSTVVRGSTYYWRVRHEGTSGGWSDWSVATVFSVSVVPPVEDVFATSLFTGNQNIELVNNGIDLVNSGGLVWIKSRGSSKDHILLDSERALNMGLSTNKTETPINIGDPISLSENGFNLSASMDINQLAVPFVSWTFRQALKFFSAITYAGSGASSQVVPYNLGIKPGVIVIKNITTTSNWRIYHSSDGNNYGLYLLNTTETFQGNYSGHVTETDFNVGNGNGLNANNLGNDYIAYLFAHDPSPEGLIQCGSYTGNGSTTGPAVSIGWEPQYLLVRRTDNHENWIIIDNKRGLSAALFPHEANAEGAYVAEGFVFLPDGFQPISFDADINATGGTYIYMAIRKPGV